MRFRAAGVVPPMMLSPPRHARLKTIVREHLEALAVPERLRWLELLSYIYAFVYHERNRAERADLRRQIEDSVQTDVHRREVSSMGKTIAEDLMEKGERRGRKREAVRSRQRILITLLRKKFDNLPEATVSAVESSTSVQELDS